MDGWTLQKVTTYLFEVHTWIYIRTIGILTDYKYYLLIELMLMELILGRLAELHKLSDDEKSSKMAQCGSSRRYQRATTAWLGKFHSVALRV